MYADISEPERQDKKDRRGLQLRLALSYWPSWMIELCLFSILVLWRIIWWMIEFWCLKELRWIVVWRIRAKGHCTTGRCISSNLFLIIYIYWIKVGYGCGGGRGVACTKCDVCKMSLQNMHHTISHDSNSNGTQKTILRACVLTIWFFMLRCHATSWLYLRSLGNATTG